jgi:hypothetical protein
MPSDLSHELLVKLLSTDYPTISNGIILLPIEELGPWL